MVSDGVGAPVITDGPYPESKELLAGYRIVDVETLDRAIEIAALASAAPGRGRRADPPPHRGAPGHERPRPRGVITTATHRGPAARARAAGPRCGRPPLRRLRRRRGRGAGGAGRRRHHVAHRRSSPTTRSAGSIRVASRRMVEQYRRDDARRRREDLAASWSIDDRRPAVSGEDDSLILIFMCCHPSLTPAAAIPLTLRAVGGLTTREIAAAFLVPEATMAQRISRAKATVKASNEPFALPSADERGDRLRSVLHVLYLLFNEGYATQQRSRPRAHRPLRRSHPARPRRARRAARRPRGDRPRSRSCCSPTPAARPAPTADGELVPLAEQDRSLWDRDLIAEGVALITEALRRGQVGEYQVQAAIAAVHDQAPRYDDTNWSEIARALRTARAHDRQSDGDAQPCGRHRHGPRARRRASRCSTAWTSSSATTTASTPCAPTSSSSTATRQTAIVEFRAAAAAHREPPRAAATSPPRPPALATERPMSRTTGSAPTYR